MASLAGQQAPQQPQQQNMNPVVEIFCEPWLMAALGWGDVAALSQFINNTPAAWGSSRAGDNNQICTYSGNFLEGLNGIAMERGSLTAICQYGLSQEYIESVINSGTEYTVAATEENRQARESAAKFNMILVQRDQREGSNGAIRGLGLISVSFQREDSRIYNTGIKLTTANTQVGTMYPVRNSSTTSTPSKVQLRPTVGIEMELLVLGNAAQPGVKTRLIYEGGVRFASGGRTIRAVQLIGAHLPRGIGLHGLETVITLYHNYGWRFRNSCQDHGESQRDHQAVLQLMAFFATADANGRRGQPAVREAWLQANMNTLMSILYELKGFGYNQHKAVDREGKSLQDHAALVMANANSGGYRMLLCQPLNIMWYIATGSPPPPTPPSGVRATKNGGRRRKRKRTKKKALKKKHRRTKRRKRKTRRRRRGGKRKLSHKKCKMLRHQHSKLTHHVNMVGKAIQAQCKKRL
jgi:hypothetical protein